MGNFKRRLYGQIDKVYSLYWRTLGLFSRLKIDIMMFHHVTDDDIEDNPSCICTIDRFKYWLNQYKEMGYHFISISEIDNAIKAKKGKYAVVSFDDVPESAITNAYPILNEQGIPFTMFIATKFIDQSGFVSKDQLISLAKNPLCTIGAHTQSHCALSQSNSSLNEITESKNILEGIIGQPVLYFAYPFGRRFDVSKKNQKEAMAAGYKYALGTINSSINNFNKNNRYYLPRIVRN